MDIYIYIYKWVYTDYIALYCIYIYYMLVIVYILVALCNSIYYFTYNFTEP